MSKGTFLADSDEEEALREVDSAVKEERMVEEDERPSFASSAPSYSPSEPTQYSQAALNMMVRGISSFSLPRDVYTYLVMLLASRRSRDTWKEED